MLIFCFLSAYAQRACTCCALGPVLFCYLLSLPVFSQEQEALSQFTRSKGYFNYSETGLNMGRNEFGSVANLYVHTVNGYAFTPQLMAGAGTGIDNFNNILVLPVFAQIRGNLDVNPLGGVFGFASAGSAITLSSEFIAVDEENICNGIYLYTGGGIRFRLKHLAAFLGAGYKRHRVTSALEFIDGSTLEEIRTIQKITLLFGVAF